MKKGFPLLVFFFPVLFWGCPMEERFIFYPSDRIDNTPRDLGLAFDDAYFATGDGVRLNGWFVPYPGAQITLLWFHGNAGNISHRLENIKLLHDKVKINIFIFDYRGYGRSEGRASEGGTYRDGEAALRYLRSRENLDSKGIVFFGRSLGAAVAADLATRESCLALILETPFASIREMARAAFPFLPIGPLLRTRYDVVEKIRKVEAPLLVLHGDRDEVVPYEQGKRVFEAARAPKEFYTIRGAHHNDTYIVGGDAYFAALKNFIERANTGRIKPS
ncbi:MAG: alpha/beta hydrolase [Deltaproteobacteria bacterium]|nr:alpha/beta hydrolase [Deltaproteobacteria bacterium]